MPPRNRKKEQVKPNCGRRKQIIKIRAEVNEIDTRKIIQKINAKESRFFER